MRRYGLFIFDREGFTRFLTQIRIPPARRLGSPVKAPSLLPGRDAGFGKTRS
jgi:hypothetical protein